MSILSEAQSINQEQEQQPQATAEYVNEIEAPMPGRQINLGWIKTPTGEGSIESYMQDPLNFDGKKSTAQILRGATGLLGNLNLALIDIALGLLQKAKERKQMEVNHVQTIRES